METGSDGIFAYSGKGGGKYAAQDVGEADFFGVFEYVAGDVRFDDCVRAQIGLRLLQHGLAHDAVEDVQIQRRGEPLSLVFDEHVASAAFEQDAVRIEKQAVERALCFGGLPRLVEEGAVGGFEAAQVVLCGQDGRRNDDALFVGQMV